MPRVLVVDDEPGVQESLRMLLRQDCDVVTAGDVDAALRVIDAELPQLILLDLLMPGRNGIELLGELADRGLQIPVIVLTAFSTASSSATRSATSRWCRRCWPTCTPKPRRPA